MTKILGYISAGALAAVGVVCLFVGFAALFSLPVYLLWNWIAVKLFAAPHITWLQAWGLLVLCNFLFKSSTTSCKSK